MILYSITSLPTGLNPNQRFDPHPGPENLMRNVAITSKAHTNVQQVVDHFLHSPRLADGSPSDLPSEQFEKSVAVGLSQTQRAHCWQASGDLLQALKEFELAHSSEISGEGSHRSSSNTDRTHYDLQHRDTITLMATVNGGSAMRGEMIPIFSKHLANSVPTEGFYDIFLKTHIELLSKVPEQVPELRSTLTKKLCLRNIFIPPSSTTRQSSARRSIRGGFNRLKKSLSFKK